VILQIEKLPVVAKEVYPVAGMQAARQPIRLVAGKIPFI
jgi:hypothetical protein